MFRLLGLLATLSLAAGFSARAEDYVLFTPYSPWVRGHGHYHPDYDQIIRKLRANDRVTFSDGTTFKLGARLGSGMASVVFALADFPDSVLRIPLHSGLIAHVMKAPATRAFLEYYWTGGKKLAYLKVPMVTLQAHLASEFIVTEKLPPDTMDFDQALLDASTDAAIRKRARAAFLRFARATAPLSNISDFRPDQMHYLPSRDTWLATDWADAHALAFNLRQGQTTVRSDTVFDSLNQIGYRFWDSWLDVLADDSSEPLFLARSEFSEEVAELALDTWRAVQTERRAIKASPERLKEVMVQVWLPIVGQDNFEDCGQILAPAALALAG